METESTHSTIDDILKTVERFRILCVGRAGVGKSSVINRVFGVKEALVAHREVGEAEIDKEFTSTENQFFTLHDSKGFEAGDTESLDVVTNFINQRRDKNLPLKDRLHAVWLCTETPTAGGRVFETGDEKLLQLAYDTETPVVVVFTKYDRLIRSKRKELRDDNDGLGSEDLTKRTEEESQKILVRCVQSLEDAMIRLKTPMPRHVNVSIKPGYQALVSSLVEVTGEVVQEKLKREAWVMWAIAQRASLPPKIKACADTGTVYYGRSLNRDKPGAELLLRDCLAALHRDLVASWNFRDEEKILSNDRFKQLMQYLVQDIQESQDRGGSYSTSAEIGKIFQFLNLITPSSATVPPLDTKSVFADWLSDTVLHNAPQVRLVLMTYIIDLTTVLTSLFSISLNRAHSSGKTTWLELKEAFEKYENSGSRQRIHRRIYAIFQQDQQILNSDSFSRMFYELVKDAEVSASASPVATQKPKPVTTPKSAPVATSSPAPVTTPNPAPVATSNPAPVATSNPASVATSNPAPVAPSSRAPEDSPEPRRRRIPLPCICQ